MIPPCDVLTCEQDGVLNAEELGKRGRDSGHDG